MNKFYSSLLIFSFQLGNLVANNPKDALLLKSGTVYPSNNIQEFIYQSIDPVEIVDGYYYRIIQFKDFPNEEQKNAIKESGIIFNGYIPYHAYNCAIPKMLDRSLLLKLNAHSVQRWDAKDKLHKTLLEKEFPIYIVNEKGKIDLVVHYQKNIPENRIKELMEEKSFSIIRAMNINHTIIIRIPENKLNELSNLPYIFYIEPISPPSIKDDTEGRSLHRSNTVNTDYVTGRHYDGSGITVGLADDGEIGPHIDFQGRLTQHLIGLGGSHGDMTSGICAGAGNLNSRMRGMGTGANLHVYDISGYPHIIDALTQYSNYGMVITSTSYSQGCNEYSSDTEFGDQLIYDYPQFELCFSAGNNGTGDCSYGAGSNWGNITGGYKVGKNVLACGNLNSTDILENSSSRGPAPDGRIKPDICSNGIDQQTTDENNTYQVGGGTSAACPGVAGSLSQLYQAYKELTGNSEVPSALIKACVLNSAEDLGNPGPDFKHGWGRINAFRATTTLEDNRYIVDSISQGQINTHTINVPVGTQQFRVMLYWHDVAGSAAVAKSLVNDLNMTVTDPAMTDFNPWILDPTPDPILLDLPAIRGVDSLNNVEQVTIESASSGSYTITINGYQIPLGTQKYYLVYEFETDSIHVTFPVGGEGIEPSATELIRWDAYGTIGTFSISYSENNGSSWNQISSSVPGSQRYFAWTVPNIVSDNVLVQVSRNGFSDISDTNFTIIRMPLNLHVTFACPDSIGLEWDPVNGATGYTVSMLGTKYMDEIGTSVSTSFVVYNTSPTIEYWFAVKALGPNGGSGPRTIALNKQPGTTNCSLSIDGSMTSIIRPDSTIIIDCLNLTSLPVTVRIQNTGITPIGNFNINYSINGGSAVTETYSGNINPGVSSSYNFTQQITGITSGSISVWLSINGDQNAFNDSAFSTFSILTGQQAVLPIDEPFESFTTCPTLTNCELTNCSLSNGWVNVPNNLFDDIDWRVNQGVTPSSSTGPDADHTFGNSTGKYIYLEASGCYSKEAILVSPCIDLTSSNTSKISFWYHMLGSDMGELHIDVITANQTYFDFAPPIIGDQGSFWLQDSVILDQFAGQIINVRFRGTTGTGYAGDMALDDINISAISTFISEEREKVKFSIYPNPGTGIYNFLAENLTGNLNSIIVEDILGKVIEKIELTGNQSIYKGQINLNKQAKGVYKVTIISDKYSSQIKLFKM